MRKFFNKSFKKLLTKILHGDIISVLNLIHLGNEKGDGYMTNTKLLESYIRKSGLKRGKIAESMGVSMNTLKKKTSGNREFKATEIKTLCDLLGIHDAEEVDRIFFAM